MLHLLTVCLTCFMSRAALRPYEVYATKRDALKLLMIELREDPLVLFYGTHSPDRLFATLPNGPVFQILGHLEDLPRETFSDLEQIDFEVERARVREFMTEMNQRARRPVDLTNPRVMRLSLREGKFAHADHQSGSDVLAPPTAEAHVHAMIHRARREIERLANRVKCEVLMDVEREVKRLQENAQAQGRALRDGSGA